MNSTALRTCTALRRNDRRASIPLTIPEHDRVPAVYSRVSAANLLKGVLIWSAAIGYLVSISIPPVIPTATLNNNAMMNDPMNPKMP